MATTTFEELGLTNPPYVTEFRDKFGKLPTMRLRKSALLPTRYRAKDGKLKFHMKTLYTSSDLFEVRNLQPTKKDPTLMNVVLYRRGDSGETRIVLTQEVFLSQMLVEDPRGVAPPRIDNPISNPISYIEPVEIIPLTPEKEKEINEKMKKEAFIWF